jgi:hypothetical protein
MSTYSERGSHGAWVLAQGACIHCGLSFSFNPVKVPSVRLNGQREPLCEECVNWANPQRVARGLPPIEVLPDAYTFCHESELNG